MQVLVTGGAGFIGSHLVEELLRRGDSVRVLDNFSTGRRSNLEPFGGCLEVVEADLRDADRVAQAVRGVEVIFHLAAFISVPQSMLEPDTCFAVNVGGTVHLLEAARRSGVRKVVLASSTAVYGDTRVIPTTEDTALAPLSPYAVSKQVTEIYARLYSQVYGLEVVALRFFNVYGPRQQPDSPYAAAIPILIDRLVSGKPITIYGSGKQSRDFIYVKDVVRANLLAAEFAAPGEAYNVCTGTEISIMDLLEELSQVSQTNPEVHYEAARPGDIYRSVGDPGKAAAQFGFRAQKSFAEGLQETLHWMRNP